MDVGTLLLLAAAVLELAQQFAPQASDAALRGTPDRYLQNPAVASAPDARPFDPYAGRPQATPPTGAAPQLQGSAGQWAGPQGANALASQLANGAGATFNGNVNAPTAQGLIERTRQQVRDTLDPLREGAKQIDSQLGEIHDNVRGRARQLLDGFGRPLADSGFARSSPQPPAQQPPSSQQPLPQYSQRGDAAPPNANSTQPVSGNSQYQWPMTPPHLLTPGLPSGNGVRAGDSSPYSQNTTLFDDRRTPQYDRPPSNFAAPPNSQQAYQQQPLANEYGRDRSAIQEGQDRRFSETQPDLTPAGRKTISHPIAPDQVGNWEAGNRSQQERFGNQAGRDGRTTDRTLAGNRGAQLPASASGQSTSSSGANSGSVWPGTDPRGWGFDGASGASRDRNPFGGNGPRLPVSPASDERPTGRGDNGGQQRSRSMDDATVSLSSDVPVISGAMLRQDPAAPLDLSEAREASMTPGDRPFGDRLGDARQSLDFPSSTTQAARNATQASPAPFPDFADQNDLARDPDQHSRSGRNPFAILLAWVLLSGSAMGNLYLFWSYMDVRTKYRALARRNVGGVGHRVSPI